MSYSSFNRVAKNRDMQELIPGRMEISVFHHFRGTGEYEKAAGGTTTVPPAIYILPARLPMATKARSFGVNEVNSGSPSRIRMVRRISFGMTTLPRSSMRRTIPVAFILKCLLCFLSCARLVFAGLHFPVRTGKAGRCWRRFSSKIKLDLVFTRSSFDKASRIVARSRRYHACASPGS